MRLTPKLGIVLVVVLVYTFSFGLLIPGFFDELGLLALAYLIFGRR